MNLIARIRNYFYGEPDYSDDYNEPNPMAEAMLYDDRESTMKLMIQQKRHSPMVGYFNYAPFTTIKTCRVYDTAVPVTYEYCFDCGGIMYGSGTGWWKPESMPKGSFICGCLPF